MISKNFRTIAFGTIVLITLSLSTFGQARFPISASSKRIIDLKLDSVLMKRQVPYRVILPMNYDVSNKMKSYPTFYLLHGLSGEIA